MRKILLLALMMLAVACDRTGTVTDVTPQPASTGWQSNKKVSCIAATPDTTTALAFLNKHSQVYNYINAGAVHGESTITSTYFTGKADHHWTREADHQLWGVEYYMHEDDGIGPVWCTEDLGTGGAALSFHSKFVKHYLGTSSSAVITRSSDLLSTKWEDDKVDMYITLLPPLGGEFPCEGDSTQLIDFTYDSGDLTIETRSGADLFGTHNLDIVWMGDVIEDAAIGDQPKSFGSEWDIGVSSSTTPAKVSDTRSHSGSQSIRSHVDHGLGSFQSGYMWEPDAGGFTEIYASWWVYFNPISNDGDCGNGQPQWKHWRLNDTASYGDSFNNFLGEIMSSGNYSPTGSRNRTNLYTMAWSNAVNLWDCNANPTTCFPWSYPDGGWDERLHKSQQTGVDMPNGADQWVRWEVYVNASSSPGEHDGTYVYRAWIDGEEVWDPIEWEGNFGTHRDISSTPGINNWGEYSRFAWQMYWGNCGEEAEWFVDDIYLQVGNRARVEIGDASCYKSCEVIEIQPPTAWAADEITVELNYGSFASDDEVYVFIILEDGTVQGGYPYIMP